MCARVTFICVHGVCFVCVVYVIHFGVSLWMFGVSASRVFVCVFVYVFLHINVSLYSGINACL